LVVSVPLPSAELAEQLIALSSSDRHWRKTTSQQFLSRWPASSTAASSPHDALWARSVLQGSLATQIHRHCDPSGTRKGRHNSLQERTSGRSLGPAAEPPRNSQRATGNRPARGGRSPLSKSPLCRPLVVTLRSAATKGLRCKRAMKERSARTARRAVSLLLLTMLVQREKNWVVGRLRQSRSIETSRRKCCFSRFYGRCETCTTPGAHFLSGGEKAPCGA